jgi:hypothetical protein
MTWKIGDEGTGGEEWGICGLKSKEKRSWKRKREI